MTCHLDTKKKSPVVFVSASVVLRALSQPAAAGPAAGVRLHEELHLHHRETIRSQQQEVRPPGCVQRSQFVSRLVLLASSSSSFIPQSWCYLLLFYVYACFDEAQFSNLYANVGIKSGSANHKPLLSCLTFQTLLCLCRWATRFLSSLWAFSGAESTGRGSSGAAPCWLAWLRCWWPCRTSSVGRMSTQTTLAVRPNTN